MRKPRMILASKSYVQSKKVLEILAENKDGLTSLQIANLLGDRMRGSVLYRLQKEGKIKQKKAILPSGRIGLVYVLNTRI
jgi:hypothetical protein